MSDHLLTDEHTAETYGTVQNHLRTGLDLSPETIGKIAVELLG
ncbi:hypothetical protein RHDE110596_15555 [Prescottella defluvii]|nr:hypothetical protein [Prescottella defluvii]